MAATLEALKPYGYHCFIIDDGSNDDTQHQLEALSKDQDWITLHRCPMNFGKGAAVMTGFALAQEHGFTHCLQIDSDGQHDTHDIPKLLLLAQEHPEAMVCGQPIYDESAPKGRMIGRKITHFWVAVETWSLETPDSMCGFRVYPLSTIMPMIKKTQPGLRMDFDIDILVRFIWQGHKAIKVPTKVIYPENGSSNFDYIKDNVRISWMHTRLFFQMLWRAPTLLKQKLSTKDKISAEEKLSAKEQLSTTNKDPHWSSIKERGSSTGMAILFKIYRLFGRIPFQIALAPVIIYFYFANKRGRQASQEFLLKAYEAGSDHPSLKYRPDHWTSLKHFFEFGRSALDKVASWTDNISIEQIIFENSKEFTDLTDQGTGGVIIGSHLGNIELSRAMSQKVSGAKVKVLVFTEHAKKFNGFLQQLNPEVRDNVIPVQQLGPDTAIFLKQCVEQGEIIVIVGDRTGIHSNNRVSFADFLGTPAPFSQGPFILASLLDCPVYLMFCLREKNKYRVHFEHFADKISLPRGKRQQTLDTLIQRYAVRLEHFSLMEPLQWFNFYSFWSPTAAETDASSRNKSEFDATSTSTPATPSTSNKNT